MAPDNNSSYIDTHTRILSLANYVIKREIVETKKQRIKRIAKEKMYASWDTHNNKTVTVNQQKQICKPAHRISFMGRKK